MTHQHSRPTVLVVDDDFLIRLFAVDILSDAGFATIEAGDGEEALSLLKQHPEIDVLFTDVHMPGPFDGLELARQVHEVRSDVGLIITSGVARPAEDEIPDHGRFIAKPYQAAAVTGLIRAAVAG